MKRTTELKKLTSQTKVKLHLVKWIGAGTARLDDDDTKPIEVIAIQFEDEDDCDMMLGITLDDAKALCEGMNKIMFALKRDEN